IKIDKSFVVDMADDMNDASIVRSVIDLGHNLGLEVVAEGVEDALTLQLLRGAECDYAQGFHVARPAEALRLVKPYGARAFLSGCRHMSVRAKHFAAAHAGY